MARRPPGFSHSSKIPRGWGKKLAKERHSRLPKGLGRLWQAGQQRLDVALEREPLHGVRERGQVLAEHAGSGAAERGDGVAGLVVAGFWGRRGARPTFGALGPKMTHV
ncbi:hypothetical protein DFJ73DRAFT_763690 [Zopfochytrium polystomum]|nr:hypothetical protein DFJ73DRAFT_763690 [Zopfochytrium polystomum]